MTKNERRPDERVQVDSLAVAAALVATGCTLTNTTQIAPKRFEFTIEGPDAEMLVADYALGRLEGNLKHFMAAFDLLRTKVRQGGRR